jgi:hypothetical protein
LWVNDWTEVQSFPVREIQPKEQVLKGKQLSSSVHLLRLKSSSHTKMLIDSLIDNFTYFCLVNRSGGRSFSDYPQYFVFSWIIENQMAARVADPHEPVLSIVQEDESLARFPRIASLQFHQR